MKKINLLSSLFVCLFVCLGCANDNSTEVLSESQTELQTKLSLEEARSEVEELLAQIDNPTKTTGTHRQIVDYYCVGKQRITRSTTLPEEELLTYVFNFNDSTGYAIVAGDKRIMSPILTMTNKGYLNPEEGVDNPGLINFLKLAECYYATEIQKYEEEHNSIQNSSTRISGGYTDWVWYGSWEVKQLLGRRTYLNWGQGSPFNDNIPLINEQKPPFGCTATATMLLMAWYQYPQVYEGYRYNWTEMLKHRNEQTNNGQANSSAFFDLAKLSEIITRPENLDMTFRVDGSGSGAWEYNIPRTLEHLGYFHGGTYADWDVKIVLNELKEYPHYPVVVAAYDTKITTKSLPAIPNKILGITIKAPTGVSYSGGHSFLLESAMIRERKIKFTYTGSLGSVTETLVFVNYGWDGFANGYYNAGVFNTVAGPVTRTSTGQNKNYVYDIDMVYGVRI